MGKVKRCVWGLRSRRGSEAAKQSEGQESRHRGWVHTHTSTGLRWTDQHLLGYEGRIFGEFGVVGVMWEVMDSLILLPE